MAQIGLDDVWLRPTVKFNEEDYYEYVLTYVDDLLAISMDATVILKTCAAFRAFMAKKLNDVWLRPDVKSKDDGYYEYVPMYVDDILAISMDTVAILKSMEGDTAKYKNDKD